MRNSYQALNRANLYAHASQVQHVHGKRRKKRDKNQNKPVVIPSNRKRILDVRAKKMRDNMTGAEAFLAEVLLYPEKINGFVFKAQVPVLYYIADFACSKRRLIVEVDGKIHETRRAYDEKRGFNLMKTGWRTLRFTNERVYADREGVLKEIAGALKAKCPPTRVVIPNA